MPVLYGPGFTYNILRACVTAVIECECALHGVCIHAASFFSFLFSFFFSSYFVGFYFPNLNQIQ